LVLLEGQNLKFPVVSKAPEKTNEKFRKKIGNFYAKLILVFGVTLK